MKEEPKKEKWQERARREVDDIIEKIKKLPFITGLIDGTLSKEHFGKYVSQDIIYCQEYATSLNILSQRLKDYNQEYSEFFAQRSQSTRKYPSYYANSFLIPLKLTQTTQVSEACQKYINLERSKVENGTLPEALCACLPCFWIYSEIGRYIYQNYKTKDKNIYDRWNEENKGEKKERLNIYLAIVNEIAEKFPESQEDMLKTYRDAVQCEHDFWEDACK